MFCWEGDLFEIFDHHAIGETDNSNLICPNRGVHFRFM